MDNSHDQWPNPHWLLVLYMDRSCVRSQYAEESKMNFKFKSYTRDHRTVSPDKPSDSRSDLSENPKNQKISNLDYKYVSSHSSFYENVRQVSVHQHLLSDTRITA